MTAGMYGGMNGCTKQPNKKVYENNYREGEGVVHIDKLLYTVCVQWLCIFSSPQWAMEHLNHDKESVLERIKRRFREVAERKKKIGSFQNEEIAVEIPEKKRKAQETYIEYCVKSFLPDRQAKSMPVTPR